MNVLRMIELEKYLKGELEINAFDNDDVMYLYLAQKMPIEDVISYIAYIHSKKINIDIIAEETIIKTVPQKPP